MGAVGKEVDLQRGGGSTENIGVSMLGVSYIQIQGNAC